MSSVNQTHNFTSRKNILFLLLLLAHVFIWVFYLWGYMSAQSINFVIAVTGLPIIIVGSITNKISYRFVLLAFAAAIVAVFIPHNAFLFLALIFSLAGLIETSYGKISIIPILIVLVISPISYFITIMSFPIRIWLTKFAAGILNLMGNTAVAAGNVISYNGIDYSVDPACTGLKMLSTSLWFSLYMLYFIQRRHNKQVRFHIIIAALSFVLFLNVITNIARIVLLVYFHVLPDNIFHELIGIACFTVYTVLPIIYVFNKLVQKLGRKITTELPTANTNSRTKLHLISSVVILVLLFVSGNSLQTNSQAFSHHKTPTIQGYHCDMFSKDVLRVKNDTSLIYVKSIPSFYSSEHNPLMCWVGSGYEFKQLKKVQRSGVEMYTGVLINNKDTLHTAWWYDNGHSQTTSQLNWRVDMIQGANHYSVVNVTCNSANELNSEIEKILHGSILNAVLQSEEDY